MDIEIMRTFVRLRRMVADHADLTERINELENRYDEQFRGELREIVIGGNGEDSWAVRIDIELGASAEAGSGGSEA